MIEITDVLKTGFLSGLYEVSHFAPGSTFEGDEMETEDGGEPVEGRKVQCTTHLGVICRFSCLPASDEEGKAVDRPRVLMKPVVVLQ